MPGPCARSTSGSNGFVSFEPPKRKAGNAPSWETKPGRRSPCRRAPECQPTAPRNTHDTYGMAPVSCRRIFHNWACPITYHLHAVAPAFINAQMACSGGISLYPL